MLLKYGRDDENEADMLGIRYSIAAGYDARQMPATYRMLARTAQLAGGETLPSWMSSHPDPGDREERTRALSREAAEGRSGLVINSRSYIESLDGVAFGHDPRQGYFERELFIHPELDFQILYPNEWKTQNTRAAVVGVEPNQQAVIQLSIGQLGDFTPADYVTELQRRGSIAGAEGSTEDLGGYQGWVGVVTVPREGGTARMQVTFIRMSEDLSLQILGQAASSSLEETVLATMRSFSKLDDRRRLNAEPDRVRIVTAQSATTFEEAIAGFDGQGIEPEATAVLNGTYLDHSVQRRELLKIVERGRRR